MQTVRDNASPIKRVRELRSIMRMHRQRLWVVDAVVQAGYMVPCCGVRDGYSAGRSPHTSPYSHSPSTNTVPHTRSRNDLDT